ncbi:NAD(P)H-binding protein [Intrasporangium sp.]|uniref:SDR family oxidoreductase n=1 Tax=Intrasporangium sp. TaxID=1925024 RepID=UPI003221E2AD
MSNQPKRVRRVLVTGGTGVLGRSVVAALQRSAVEVRVLSRGIRPVTGLSNVELVTGDVRKGEGLETALRDVDVVVHCTQPVDAVIERALRADRPHVVYISIVGVDSIPFGFYPTKLADERHLAASGLPWSVLRATQFHDLVAALLLGLSGPPVMLLPKGVRIQPVEVAEVGERLAALALGAPTGRIDQLGGPEVRTMRSLGEAVLDRTRRRRRIVEVPVPGKAGQAFAAGHNLAPEHADGRTTFEQYLHLISATGERPYAGAVRAYLSPRRLLRAFRPL